MAIIKTDNQHYIDIANMIREKTGNNISYSPQDMASGVEDVYNVGYNDGLRQVSGETMKYTRIYEALLVREEDVTAAGEDGIKILTIGNPDIDLSRYSEILIRLWVPKSDTTNSNDGFLCIYGTPTSVPSKSDNCAFLRSQASSGVTNIDNASSNMITTVLTFSGEAFAYGQIFRNGAASYGYPGPVYGWNYLSSSVIKKSQIKYFHIFSFKNDFKFPKNTQVVVLGR